MLSAVRIGDVREKMKKALAIVGIAIGVVWVGAGCKSLSGDLEIDTPFFDVSYESKEAE